MNILEHIQDFHLYRSLADLVKSDPVDHALLTATATAAAETFASLAPHLTQTAGFGDIADGSDGLDPTVPTPEAYTEIDHMAESPAPSLLKQEYDQVHQAEQDLPIDVTEPLEFVQDGSTTQANKNSGAGSRQKPSAKANGNTTAGTRPYNATRSQQQQQQQQDFVLKRIFHSFTYAIANQSRETDIGNGRLGALMLYLVSPFSVLCIVMALILNRTVAFATTRRPVPLTFPYRLMLRSLAIYLLFSRIYSLIQAMTCPKTGSTSPTYVKLKTYIPSYFAIKEGEECPSPAVLWDLYWSICVGHFIETFSNVIQGLPLYSESGMTLFEYSMAFQEVQSSHYMSMETLVLSLISAISLITVHAFGAFNLQEYRLIPSTFFGVTFLSYFAYSAFIGRIFYFPTVCIIGYLPQLVLCVIILICGAIYGLAAFFSGGQRNLRTSFRTVPMSLSEDFYTCLVKIGVIALTTATKATYLNESVTLSHPLMTWVDKKALEESKRGESGANDEEFWDLCQGSVLYPPLVTLAPDGKTIVERPDAKLKLAKLQAKMKKKKGKKVSPYDNEIAIPAQVEAPQNSGLPGNFEGRAGLGFIGDDEAGPNRAHHAPGAGITYDQDKEHGRFRTTHRIYIVLGMLRGVVIILASVVLRFAMKYLGLKYLFKYVLRRNYDEDAQRHKMRSAYAMLRAENKRLFGVNQNGAEEDDDEDFSDEVAGDENVRQGLKDGLKLFQKLQNEIVFNALDADEFSEYQDDDDDDDYEDIEEEAPAAVTSAFKGKGKTMSRAKAAAAKRTGGRAYMNLLWGDIIPDCDDSRDYEPPGESDNDGYSTDEYGYEYESDYDGTQHVHRRRARGRGGNYGDHVSTQRGAQDAAAEHVHDEDGAEKGRSTLEELYELLIPTPEDLLALISPKSAEQVERRRLLVSHLQDAAGLVAAPDTPNVDLGAITKGLLGASAGLPESSSGHAHRHARRPVTRSQYAAIEWDETQALLQTINERRTKYVADEEVRETLCVVCQCSAREIILWPCKCFALCEDCRLTLAMKSFKGCVCCRRKVKSFSKVYVP